MKKIKNISLTDGGFWEPSYWTSEAFGKSRVAKTTDEWEVHSLFVNKIEELIQAVNELVETVEKMKRKTK